MEWVGEHGWQPLDVCIDWQDNPSRLENPRGLDNFGRLDNFDVVDDLDNFDSVAMQCNLVSSGETYWHLEGCLNLQTACALS